MRALKLAWHEVQPVEVLKETAVRLLRVHALRAGDSLQLAAAALNAGRTNTEISARQHRWNQ